MKSLLSLAAITIIGITHLSAATLYVSVTSTNPVAPYAGWATAATNLQQAIDVAAAGDEVVATDGTYTAITVNKQMLIRSENGPIWTFIDGHGNGRCAWLTNGVGLSGFQLQHGIADTAAGIFCDSTNVFITNCIVFNNSAINVVTQSIGSVGGVFGGTLYNCSIRNNSAVLSGGGTFGGILFNCTINGNTAGVNGGGVCSSTLFGCTVGNNSSGESGGGASGCQLSNCVLFGNSSIYGGGAEYSIMDNCIVTNNTGGQGGGTFGGTLTNCLVIANKGGAGLGSHSSTLYNCRLLNNSSTDSAIRGGGANNCNLNGCLLANNSLSLVDRNAYGGGAYQSSLSHCILSNNTAYIGGGESMSILTNCILVGNKAGLRGGGSGVLALGSASSVLYNCLLVGNSVSNTSATTSAGGGASGSKLYNCTVVGNSATNSGGISRGGGIYNCQAYNCIVYSNTAWGSGDNYYSTESDFINSCTTPLPAGPGNITNAPQFMNFAGGDFRLLGASPGVNAGDNVYVSNGVDYAGNPRIAGGTVDMGAYEFQSTHAPAFYAWLQSYGIVADGTADFEDPDHDLLNNFEEWLSGTCPTNTTPITADLVALWKFDDGAGTNAHDSVSLSDGALKNFPSPNTHWVPGKVGGALQFGGPSSANYIYVPSYTKPTSKMACAAWVWAESLSGWASFIKNWGSSGVGQFHFGMSIYGCLSIYIGQADNAVYTAIEDETFPAGSWQHVAFTCDGAQIHLYRNGVEVAVGSYNGTLSQSIDCLGIGAKLADGCNGNAANGNTGYWEGKMDDLGLWRRSLAPAEIQALYAAGSEGRGIENASLNPVLAIQTSGTNIVFSWPELPYGNSFSLVTASAITSTNWTSVDAPIQVTNQHCVVTVPKPVVQSTFFRLRK
jgi:hypothetical protein